MGRRRKLAMNRPLMLPHLAGWDELICPDRPLERDCPLTCSIRGMYISGVAAMLEKVCFQYKRAQKDCANFHSVVSALDCVDRRC